MKKNDAVMTRARRVNPIPPDEFKGFADTTEAQEILSAILLSAPQQTEGKHTVPDARRRPSSFARVGRTSLALGLAALAIFGITTIGTPDRPDPSRDPVWTPELVSFAKASPRLLITQQGWTVFRAEENSDEFGEMEYWNGADDAEARGVGLYWRPVDFHERHVEDRRRGAARSWKITVAGHEGVLFRYRGSGHLTALWIDDQHSIELSGDLDNVEEFRALAGTIEKVDVDTWLSAMPESVIKSDRRAATVDNMLLDVPVPDDLDMAKLKSIQGVSDRYQLGARVTSAVACAWINQWVNATDNGNSNKRQEAVAAMQTSHDWAILREMQSKGGWSEVLWEYADAMAAGNYSMIVDETPGDDTFSGYRAGLGCDNP
jgi:hypothetical protein